MIKGNLGKRDRSLRLVIALVLFFLAYGNYGSMTLKYIMITVGIVFLLTSIFGWCGLYSMFGISSRGRLFDKISKKDINRAIKNYTKKDNSIQRMKISNVPSEEGIKQPKFKKSVMKNQDEKRKITAKTTKKKSKNTNKKIVKDNKKATKTNTKNSKKSEKPAKTKKSTKTVKKKKPTKTKKATNKKQTKKGTKKETKNTKKTSETKKNKK